jgi:hypothetical protein
MAEEPGKHRGSDIGKLHNTGDDERGQWNIVSGNRDEPGYERDEQCSDADGKHRSEHHHAAGEPNGECGADCDIHTGGDRGATFELSVAEEPSKYRWSDISKLHNPGDDERGQWNIVPSDRDERSYERDEQCSDANGKHRPKYHDAAGKPNGKCGADGDVHSGGDRSATFELPVAEEPGKYRGSNFSKLYDAGDNEHR